MLLKLKSLIGFGALKALQTYLKNITNFGFPFSEIKNTLKNTTKTMNIKLIYRTGIAIFAIGVFFLAGCRFLKSKSEPNNFQTAVVEIGSVISSIPAQGIVEPENEVLILSPASGIIVNILKSSGSKVRAGEVIMKLNTRAILDQIDQIEDQLKVKENNLQRTLLNAQGIRVDLGYSVEVKKLKIASLKADLADQKQLLEVGGISTAKFEKTQQELTLAEKDLETIQKKNLIRLQQLEADRKGLELQIDIQKKTLEAKQELLSRMTIKAPSNGIILEVNGKEGEKVSTDRLLVRLSDMSTFKIRASIADKFGNTVKTGRRVYAQVDRDWLQGTIGNVSPEIRDRKIDFDVHLDKSDNKNLRPNLTVELKVVESQKDSVLRIIQGPVLEKGHKHQVVALTSEGPVSREIKTGLKGDRYVEIVAGAKQGDRLIVSEISSLEELQKTNDKESSK